MSEDLDGVMRRIAKLLAIANDARANPGEAAAAASMAEKVMRKYQIDHADVVVRNLRSAKPDLSQFFVFANMKRDDPKRPAQRNVPAWGQMLAASIGRLNDCAVKHGMAVDKHGKLSAALAFQGHTPDATLCCWIFDFVVGQLIKGSQNYYNDRRAARVGKDEGYYKTIIKADKKAANDYRLGFVTAVCNELARKYEQKTWGLKSNAQALMVISTKLDVVKERFGETKTREWEPDDTLDPRAWMKGLRDGNAVDLNVAGIEGGIDPGSPHGDQHVEFRYKLGR